MRNMLQTQYQCSCDPRKQGHSRPLAEPQFSSLNSVQDFFYVCAGHLKDKGFCTPIIDDAAVAAKKKKEMEAEIERVKLEFEEKQKKKKEREKEKSKDNDKDKDKDTDKATDKKDEKNVEDKVDFAAPLFQMFWTYNTQQKSDKTQTQAPDEEPRVFALKKAFYQQRIDKKRQAEVAKRNRERFQNPNLFPQVPKDLP